MLYDKRYGEVIEVESGQTKKRVEKKCVKTLNEKQGAGEYTICADMLNTCIDRAKKNLSNASNCQGMHHFVTYLNDAVDKIC